MELRILEEGVGMDHIRRILVEVAEVVGIEEGAKSIVTTTIVAVVAIATEIMTVEEVVEQTTMIVVDHPSVVTMV